MPAWPVPSPRRRLPIVSAALPFQLPQNGCQRFAASAWRSNVDRKHVRGSKSLHSAGSLQLHSEATKHGSTMFHQRPLPNEAAGSKRSMSTFVESMQYSRKYHGPCCCFHAVYLGAAWPAGYASLLPSKPIIGFQQDGVRNCWHQSASAEAGPRDPRIPLCVPGPLHPCILDEGFWIQPYLVLEPKAKIGVATIGSFVQGVMTLVVGIGQIDAFFPQPGTGLLHSCQGCKDASCRRQEISGSLLAQPGAHLDVPTPRSQL